MPYRLTPRPPQSDADLHLRLLEQNREWSARMLREHPELFTELARHQRPFALWIGCSDSRVPPNELTGTMPGDLFVHRNVANMVVHTDMNLLSVLDFAVGTLDIHHVIVCGHYGCGGVTAALGNEGHGLVDNWVRRIRDIYRLHRDELDAIAAVEERMARLVELNVAEQVYDLSRTSVLRSAWDAGRAIKVHGWVYGLHDGLLKDLEVTRSRYEPEIGPPPAPRSGPTRG